LKLHLLSIILCNPDDGILTDTPIFVWLQVDKSRFFQKGNILPYGSKLQVIQEVINDKESFVFILRDHICSDESACEFVVACGSWISVGKAGDSLSPETASSAVDQFVVLPKLPVILPNVSPGSLQERY
jgi:hypothetical protein